MTAPVLHINGWPGTGKATIGRILAARLGGRLIDNHLMLDPAGALFGRGDPRHARLRTDIRDLIHAAALTLPDDVPLIVTDALASTDDALFAPTRALAQARGAPLICFILDITSEENRARLTDPRRTGSKLTDVSILDDLRTRHELLQPDGAIALDVTNQSPDDAATLIIQAMSGAEAAAS